MSTSVYAYLIPKSMLAVKNFWKNVFRPTNFLKFPSTLNYSPKLI